MGKIEYMVMSYLLNAGQNYNLLTANKSFESVANFQHLGMAITNQNCIHDEIRSRLNSRYT
jgi:hypothetical protein